MKNTNPLVSICVPTLNRASFLCECIQSILKQSYSNFQIIISDNASTDNTEEIVSSFSDDRISYFKNDKTIDLASNINRAIEHAKGEYITVFHDDDIMYPDNIKEKVEVLNNNSSVGMAHSDIKRINENSKVIGKHWAKAHNTDFHIKGKDFFELLLTDNNPVCAPSVMFRRRLLDKTGPFNQTLNYSCDWNLWMKIACNADIAYVNKPLIYYRCHEDMVTNKYLRTAGIRQIFKAKMNAIKYAKNVFNDNGKYKKQVISYTKQRTFKLAKKYILRGNFAEGLKSLIFGISLRAGFK